MSESGSVKELQVPKAINELGATMEAITEVTRKLMERLSPVMRQLDTKQENDKSLEVREIQVPIAETLNSFNRQGSKALVLLHEIMRLLEI